MAHGEAFIVVIEDIHWMDDSSRELAAYLIEHLRRRPILLILTARPLEAPGDLAGAQTTMIPLMELSRDESLAMLSEALELPSLPGDVGDAVYAKTRGNPLFLEEVAFALRSRARWSVFSAPPR